MDDNVKAKHELMTKILSWGMIVYFLVLGYSLNQSALFELRTNKDQEKLAVANREQAKLIREQSNLNNSDAKTKVTENIKAAKLDYEAKKLEDEICDGKRRSGGLIIGATVFFIFYLLLIHKFYQKFKTEMNDYFVSKKVVMFYAVFIGLSIWVTAFMTAYY